LKYGALSVETGTLDVSGGTDGTVLSIVWTERGGPMVEAPGSAEGYGSKLVMRSISGQLGGTIHYDWSTEGVIVTIKIDEKRLAG
jgi:two-component sensor histidine kinase